MSEKLLNLKEVAQYLGISEEDLRILVDRGEIPAYRLGGTILRFRKDQVDQLLARGVPKIPKSVEGAPGTSGYTSIEKWKDFLYFNDFYLVSAIIIVILLIVIFFY